MTAARFGLVHIQANQYCGNILVPPSSLELTPAPGLSSGQFIWLGRKSHRDFPSSRQCFWKAIRRKSVTGS